MRMTLWSRCAVFTRRTKRTTFSSGALAAASERAAQDCALDDAAASPGAAGRAEAVTSALAGDVFVAAAALAGAAAAFAGAAASFAGAAASFAATPSALAAPSFGCAPVRVGDI